MTIRHATIEDLEAITEVEKVCFPKSEAASKERFYERIKHFGNHFWLLLDDDKLVAFVDGMVTVEKDLRDEMYEKASMHDEAGDWLMIFGVNTIPDYRLNGCASKLIRTAIEQARGENRKGVVLTCKEKLIPFYSRFGFVNEGITDDSHHGGAVWYQMRIEF